MAFLRCNHHTTCSDLACGGYYTAYPEALLVESLGQVRICYWRVGKSGVPFQGPVDVEDDIK